MNNDDLLDNYIINSDNKKVYKKKVLWFFMNGIINLFLAILSYFNYGFENLLVPFGYFITFLVLMYAAFIYKSKNFIEIENEVISFYFGIFKGTKRIYFEDIKSITLKGKIYYFELFDRKRPIKINIKNILNFEQESFKNEIEQVVKKVEERK